MKGKESFKTAGLVVALLLFMWALYMIFIFVPTEATMGISQRIFYFHVPLAWLGLLGYTLVFFGSIMYLWKRRSGWDNFSSSAAELGFIFTTLFLISGSLWAKPAWGVWWTWTPRLTTALILWFIYIAYLTVRFYASEKQQGARFGAVVGIVGFVDVPIIAISTSLWRSEHPGALVFQGGLTPEMTFGLMVSIAAFTVLFVYFLAIRTSLKQQEMEVERLRELVEQDQ
ncbi:MAG: cytochrome c biogenesis protein [Dehalococcoidia bacterium]|nr:cytochrome c biogenesis protein [Dehalococcoidia bacterium]